jgi:ubiquinone/menaquinone biosynthesis C-methylase UbiE
MKKYIMNIMGKTRLTQDSITHIYNELFQYPGRLRDSEAYYHWVLDRLHLTAGSSLLDIACGEGMLVYAARKRLINGYGVDISSQGLKLAYQRLRLPIISIANGERLPFRDQSFDFVTNLGSLEHFLDPQSGIREMIRVLKLNGKAALSLPNSYYLADILWQVWRTGYSASHRQPLERFAAFREWWDTLEEGGFRVVKAYKYNFCFPRSRDDLQWYRRHPKKILNLLIAPFIPFNLSNHFLFICLRR